MSVSIIEILTGDKGLDLQNGYWARQPTILGNWQTIRIGARIHVNQADATGLVSTPNFRFGMCSGMTNVPGKVADGTVDHSLCFRSALATWTYNAAGLLAMSSSTNRWEKIESGTRTTHGASQGTTYAGAISSAPAVIRVPMIFTITRGSPNFNIRGDVRTSTSAGSGYDVSLETLYMAMESSNPTTVLGAAFLATNTDIAFDEATHGNLDTLFVTWGQTSPAIYVSELLVARIA